MDFYSNNPNKLRRLLTKRQNPCTQVFKAQPSNPTNVPMTTMNLHRNDISATQDDRNAHLFTPNSPSTNFPPNNIFQSAPQINIETEFVQSQSSDLILEEDEDGDGDAPCGDRIIKKIRTNSFSTIELKSRRESNYEEEKEDSDPSTSCETRSELNTVHEHGEFFVSPKMNHQYVKDPSELNLDQGQTTISRDGSVSTNASGKESESVSRKTQDIINQIGENLAACNFDPESQQKIKCKMGHQWELNLGNFTKGCPRCSDLLHECKEFARKNEGSCLNQEYEEKIHYRCIKGHCWSLNYKNARRRWCAQCAKEQRAFLKKKCEEEKVEREKQDEEFQRKLFEEARKKAMQDNQKSQSFGHSQAKPTMSGSESSQKPMNMMEYLQRIDFETESLAKKYTAQFMSQKEFGGDLNYQQILQVYKILIMPEQVLQTYMLNLSAETLRAEFRRMAKLIHPDKNKHPQAGNAFQKIYKVYEVALSRHEGSQQKI